MDFEGSRARGRPAKRWKDLIRADTKLPPLTAERLAKERDGWKQSVKKFMQGSTVLRSY